MLLPQNNVDKIKKGLAKLKSNVELKLFTDFKTIEDGSKSRACSACEGAYSLLKTLEELSNERFSFEEISIEEKPEEAIRYKVSRIPAILFVNDDGNEIIRYSAHPTGSEFFPFLDSIIYFSGVRPSYADQILTHLKKIDKSNLKIFITPTCPYCPETVPVLTLFAIVSKGKITAEVIDVNLNPDIAVKYDVQGVPLTIVNEKERIVGMFTPQDLLDKLTKGQRDFGGMYA